MLSHVPGLETYNSKQPFSLVNGVAVQIYRQASKLTSSPGSLRLHIKITCDYITLQIYMRPAQRRGRKSARLALGRFTWPCGFSSPAINSLPAEKRAGLNLRLEFIRPLLFSESEIGTVRQFGPLFGLSHYLSFGWSPWHKSESWSYICAPAFLIPFPAEYRSSE